MVRLNGFQVSFGSNLVFAVRVCLRLGFVFAVVTQSLAVCMYVCLSVCMHACMHACMYVGM